MTALKRRLRSLLVALAVLALSAGVALAGRTAHLPSQAPAGTTAQGDQADQDEQAEADESEAPDADESEAPDAEAPDGDADEGSEADAPDTERPDATDAGDAAGAHPDNHGLLVSEAASAATPTGFDNHGAYVRTVAQANHGHDQAAASKARHGGKGPH